MDPLHMQTALVVGGAKSGVAVSKLLKMHGWHVTLTDQKTIAEAEELTQLGILVVDGGHPDFLLCRYDLVVKNPGIPLTAPFIRQLQAEYNEIVNEIEVACRLTSQFRFGAITGTNGKTTTTSLLHACLKKFHEDAVVAGNIGIPLSQVVLEMTNAGQCGNDSPDNLIPVALELSSFQLQTMPSFRPNVAVILNLTPDHLDYHADLDEYHEAKTNIYKNMAKHDVFLCNVDDEMIMKWTNGGKDVPCRVLYYSMKQNTIPSMPIDILRKDYGIYFHDTLLFDERKLRLVGQHNIQNAMVAASMAYILGASVPQIQDALQEFCGVEHRLEFVRELHGVKYYNDSKGTNTDAAKIALSSFPSSIIWLAGGKDKGTGYADLIPCLNRVKTLIAFGEAKSALEQWAKTSQEYQAGKLQIHLVKTLQEAVILATALSSGGDTVLLSPACSSFDQFTNYEERGKVFKEVVRSL